MSLSTSKTGRLFELQAHKKSIGENLPVKLKYRLQDVYEIYTVRDRGRNALENGDLIAAMQSKSFDYLITSDKNPNSAKYITHRTGR